MKLGIFTDLHYTKHPAEGREYTALAPERVREAMKAFDEEKVDAVVCLGDVVDRGADHEEELSCWREILSEIKKYPYPFFVLPGNHDYELMIGDEFGKVSGMPEYPFYADIAGYRLIFLDACYRHSGKRYDEAGMVWTETMLPQPQLDYLQEMIEQSELPCLVFTHQNLDKDLPKEYRIKRCMHIRRLLKNSGKVIASFSGHFHAGAYNVLGGIKYFTVPSMTDTDVNEYMIVTL